MDSRNPQRQGNLKGPLVIVAANDSTLFLVRAQDADDPLADAQIYDLEGAELFDQIKPLAIWFKFMYYVDKLDPPVPFTEHERTFRLAAYRAAKRAREAAEREAEATDDD
jgi:hypothetical protein